MLRIIIQKGKYKIQKKFLWWWNTLSYLSVGIDGAAAHEDLCFNSREEAIEYTQQDSSFEIVAYIDSTGRIK